MLAHTHIHTDHLLHICVCVFDSWGIKYMVMRTHTPTYPQACSSTDALCLQLVECRLPGSIWCRPTAFMGPHLSLTRTLARTHTFLSTPKRQTYQNTSPFLLTSLHKPPLQCECVRSVRWRVHEGRDCKCPLQFFPSDYRWTFVPSGGATRRLRSVSTRTLCLGWSQDWAPRSLTDSAGAPATLARAWRTVSAGLSLPRPSLL